MSPPKYDWSKADELWGRCIDDDIALAVGCSRGAVVSHRLSRNIAAALPFSKDFVFVDWSRADGMWGNKTDKEIAEVLGTSVGTVGSKRARAQIPAKKSTTTMKDWSKVEGMWSSKTDEEIAAVVGASVSTVYAYRLRNLLPRFPEKVEAPHGTLVKYAYHGCRCDLCRAAKAKGQRDDYRRRRGLPIDDTVDYRRSRVAPGPATLRR